MASKKEPKASNRNTRKAIKTIDRKIERNPKRFDKKLEKIGSNRKEAAKSMRNIAKTARKTGKPKIAKAARKTVKTIKKK